MNTDKLRDSYERQKGNNTKALIPEVGLPTPDYFRWLEDRLLKVEAVSDRLEKDSDFLRCLRAAGVDNWEGYDIAQDMCSYETD